MISFILNLPHTIVGIVLALVSNPNSITWISSPNTIVFRVRSLWWAFGYLKGLRAASYGHVILLGPATKSGDYEHELAHVRQYEKHPLIQPALYSVELVKHGYKNNKYEVEAYQEAGNEYEKKV
jgi:hypothetical protein